MIEKMEDDSAGEVKGGSGRNNRSMIQSSNHSIAQPLNHSIPQSLNSLIINASFGILPCRTARDTYTLPRKLVMEIQKVSFHRETRLERTKVILLKREDIV